MRKTKITAPVKGFTGPGPGGLPFEDGIAHTDDPALINYFTDAGYGIGDDDPAVAELETPDPRTLENGGVTVVGSPLRDAAVEPEPGDFLPPTNAGLADPHGPLVNAPGIHAVESQPIRPGRVHVDDLDTQEELELAQAEALLTEGQTADEALAAFTDASDTGPLGLSDPGSAEQGVEDARPIAEAEAARAAFSSGDEASEQSQVVLDPTSYTVAQVNDYLDEHPDEVEGTLSLEAAGKNRAGIVTGRHATRN